MKKAILEDSKILTVTREGNSFHYKTHIGDADVDFAEKIGEQAEWEEKEKNPILHIKMNKPCLFLICL